MLSRDRIKNILNCDDVGHILTELKENDQSERNLGLLAIGHIPVTHNPQRDIIPKQNEVPLAQEARSDTLITPLEAQEWREKFDVLRDLSKIRSDGFLKVRIWFFYHTESHL